MPSRPVKILDASGSGPGRCGSGWLLASLHPQQATLLNLDPGPRKQLLELPRLVSGHRVVAPPDELGADEHLRHRLPARGRGGPVCQGAVPFGCRSPLLSSSLHGTIDAWPGLPPPTHTPSRHGRQGILDPVAAGDLIELDDVRLNPEFLEQALDTSAVRAVALHDRLGNHRRLRARTQALALVRGNT